MADKNSTVIPVGNNTGFTPGNLIKAVTEIQQFSVIEKNGPHIPGDFLGLEGSISLFNVGIKSGLNEGLFIILLAPVFSLYIIPYLFDTNDIFIRILLNIIPYIALIINTGLCIFVSRFYVGTITRKAVNSLFMGRTSILIIKAFFLYVIYQVIYKLSTPEYVWMVAKHFPKPEHFYYGYMHIRPNIQYMSSYVSIIMCIAAILPYAIAFLFDQKKKSKRDKNINKYLNNHTN